MNKHIDINKINDLLHQGIVPTEMYYTKEKKIIIDPEKIDYNLYPSQNLCGSIVEDIKTMTLSPLEEYNIKKYNLDNNINE